MPKAKVEENAKMKKKESECMVIADIRNEKSLSQILLLVLL
jgi:hypothetical protein